MSKITMFWHGGSSYAVFDVTDPKDAEHFSSLASAKREFRDRVHDRYYPCVNAIPADEGGPSAWLFFGEVGDCPDAVMEFGPRGGVRVTPA